MQIGIPKELRARERRVALAPSGVRALVQQGHQVWVEAGAGAGAGFADADYESAGATIVFGRLEAILRSEILACVHAPEPAEYELLQPGQTVIAGSKAAVERACEGCKARGAKRAVLLPVSAPFHSSLIRPAADKLAARLAELEFKTPSIPVINNVDVAIENDPLRIKDALIRQAYSPVRWVETIQKMAAMGMTEVAECGPGKVLAGLVKRSADGVTGIALADAAAIDATLPILG